MDTLDETMAARFTDMELEHNGTTTEASKNEIPSLTTLSAALKQKIESAEGDGSEVTSSQGENAEEPMEETTPRPSSAKRAKSYSPFGESNTFRFFSGNPTVEKTEGIIHLYKRE